MSPQYVKPYVKTNKTNVNDAEAICEVVKRLKIRKECLEQGTSNIWQHFKHRACLFGCVFAMYLYHKRWLYASASLTFPHD